MLDMLHISSPLLLHLPHPSDFGFAGCNTSSIALYILILIFIDMSSLIARIIVRSPSNHSRAVHAAACPASHPRLSFADLDRLLEQEERMLAPQQTNHTAGHEDTIDEEGLNESWDVEVVEHADEETDQTEDKRKGSRTETHGEGEQDTRKGSRTETQHDVDGDGGEEQTRKASRDGEKADRKDLLELKESALDDLRTISAAEEHLMKDKSSIMYVPQPQAKTMMQPMN